MKWTQSAIDQLIKNRNVGVSWRTLAELFETTEDAVRMCYRTHSPSTPVPAEEDPKRTDYWKRTAGKLAKQVADLEKSRTAVDVLVEQVLECAPKSYTTTVPAVKRKPGQETPQPAVLLFSDTHIGKIVKPDQTLGMGDYNFQVFLSRLQRLEEAVASIIVGHTTSEVPEIVVAMLGDMLDGALDHSAECGQSNTLLAQYFAGGHAIAQFLSRLSQVAPLRIHTTVGNHTRWQNQHKMPTENRNSNLDQFLYVLIQALTRENKRIQWHLDWQPFTTFQVADHQFFAGHGDNLRGGDKALGIPNHAVGRTVGTMNQLFSRAGMETPHYFCFGHLHRPITLPHTKGEIIVNGAFPGVDGYSLTNAFNSSYPSQKFFLMHPRYGRTACYDIRLDFPPAADNPYVIPEPFTCQ